MHLECGLLLGWLLCLSVYKEKAALFSSLVIKLLEDHGKVVIVTEAFVSKCPLIPVKVTHCVLKCFIYHLFVKIRNSLNVLTF